MFLGEILRGFFVLFFFFLFFQFLAVQIIIDHKAVEPSAKIRQHPAFDAPHKHTTVVTLDTCSHDFTNHHLLSFAHLFQDESQMS